MSNCRCWVDVRIDEDAARRLTDTVKRLQTRLSAAAGVPAAHLLPRHGKSAAQRRARVAATGVGSTSEVLCALRALPRAPWPSPSAEDFERIMGTRPDNVWVPEEESMKDTETRVIKIYRDGRRAWLRDPLGTCRNFEVAADAQLVVGEVAMIDESGRATHLCSAVDEGQRCQRAGGHSGRHRDANDRRWGARRIEARDTRVTIDEACTIDVERATDMFCDAPVLADLGGLPARCTWATAAERGAEIAHEHLRAHEGCHYHKIRCTRYVEAMGRPKVVGECSCGARTSRYVDVLRRARQARTSRFSSASLAGTPLEPVRSLLNVDLRPVGGVITGVTWARAAELGCEFAIQRLRHARQLGCTGCAGHVVREVRVKESGELVSCCECGGMTTTSVESLVEARRRRARELPAAVERCRAFFGRLGDVPLWCVRAIHLARHLGTTGESALMERSARSGGLAHEDEFLNSPLVAQERARIVREALARRAELRARGETSVRCQGDEDLDTANFGEG